MNTSQKCIWLNIYISAVYKFVFYIWDGLHKNNNFFKRGTIIISLRGVAEHFYTILVCNLIFNSTMGYSSNLQQLIQHKNLVVLWFSQDVSIASLLPLKQKNIFLKIWGVKPFL
jgi:hypothetical protein